MAVDACRKCGVTLQHWRSPDRRHRRAGRGLCTPCYDHLCGKGGLDEYPLINRPAHQLAAEAEELRATYSFTWHQIALELGVTVDAIKMARAKVRNQQDAA